MYRELSRLFSICSRAIKAGKLSVIRIAGLKGNMNADLNWTHIEDAAGTRANATMPGYNEVPLDRFSSTCFYFAEALVQAGSTTPLGLVHTAVGGSWIEEWLTLERIQSCKAGEIGPRDGLLFDTKVNARVACACVCGKVYVCV